MINQQIRVNKPEEKIKTKGFFFYEVTMLGNTSLLC